MPRPEPSTTQGEAFRKMMANPDGDRGNDNYWREQLHEMIVQRMVELAQLLWVAPSSELFEYIDQLTTFLVTHAGEFLGMKEDHEN